MQTQHNKTSKLEMNTQDWDSLVGVVNMWEVSRVMLALQ